METDFLALAKHVDVDERNKMNLRSNKLSYLVIKLKKKKHF